MNDCACTMSTRTFRSTRQVSPSRPGPMPWLPRRFFHYSRCPSAEATNWPREHLVLALWCREDLLLVRRRQIIVISATWMPLATDMCVRWSLAQSCGARATRIILAHLGMDHRSTHVRVETRDYPVLFCQWHQTMSRSNYRCVHGAPRR